MPMPLPDNDIQQFLSRSPKWKRNDNAIERVFDFPDFGAAMRFVNRVADIAESMNHHPGIAINYNKVKISLMSHDSGGVTNRDLSIAARIESAASES